MKCSERDGITEDDDCCLHDLLDNDQHAPGKVCCWCGDIYQPDYELNSEHGEYKPSPHFTVKKEKGEKRGIKRFKGILR